MHPLKVDVGEIPLDVHEIRNGDPAESGEPKCGGGRRDSADPRIWINRSNGHAMSVGTPGRPYGANRVTASLSREMSQRRRVI